MKAIVLTEEQLDLLRTVVHEAWVDYTDTAFNDAESEEEKEELLESSEDLSAILSILHAPFDPESKKGLYEWAVETKLLPE